MAAGKCSEDQWVEIQKASSEKRRELVLQGPNIDKKIVSGGLDVNIYSLSLLNYLEISQCPNLTEIHPEIANLINLQSLILCRNKLCSVPEAIGSLKSLKVLDVSGNELTCLPFELSHLSELNTLNVSCNKIRSLPDGLSKCVKLASINVSKNEISNLPEDLFSSDLEHLSTIIASENAIEELSGNIYGLSALKNLDLSNNKITEIPFDLADCSKLKEVNFRGNKLKDKRLEKMVNGCQTKSILDYLRAGGRGKGRGKQQEGTAKDENTKDKRRKKRSDKHQKNKEEDEELDDLNQMVVKVLQVHDSEEAFTIKVAPQVKDVRPYIVCCIVKGMNLKQGNALKRFLTAQIKLHDEICERRTSATIATHDLHRLRGPLLYDARSPKTLKLVPLSRKEMNAAELLRQLQFEAEEQRKHKKRQNVSGLHKYLQLLDGKENYPCLVDAEDNVISFPPITNTEKTKMRKSTRELLLEVTSAINLQTCKDVMDALIVKMAELNKATLELKEEIVPDDGEPDLADGEQPLGTAPEGMTDCVSSELVVQQVRVVDLEGNLKVIYPSKIDLNVTVSNLTVIR
ncbi:leucine-rich repeat-containing protein 47 [Brienomyrus brachyistius]|uniref:leucine-rich repeat-containing protein 47 n=1 Tax=Brienomyrus brachyistius TaxID=42636 RepID=UPI0020B3D800|nr:leucine-rich repeat-containing protein 47 [Brienomyrus brachyistius]